MAFEKTDKIWMNGKFVKWDDAKIHILSHVIHYGTALFEGARCYKTKKGSAIFRLQPHTDRLFNSCKMYRIEVPYTKEEVNNVFKEAADGRLKGILDYTDEPLVSRDFQGNPHSAIIDGRSTMVIAGNLVKVLAWYDNEWGFSVRMTEMIELIDKLS